MAAKRRIGPRDWERLTSRAVLCGFVVWAPDYTLRSAGVRCLYELAADLRRHGVASFLCGGTHGPPVSVAPIVSLRVARALCSRGCVAIYSETVSGNPLKADRVVRWVLNSPGLLGGERVYEQSETVLLYSEVYRRLVTNRVDGVLYRPMIDQDLFHPGDSPAPNRELVCFYVGKSSWREGVLDRNAAFEITRDEPARSELGKLLRHTRILYCFDNSTMLIYEALLCGCSVIVVPDGTHSRADYERLELGAEGIGWWPDDLHRAPPDPRRIRDRLTALESNYHIQVRRLIRASGFDSDPRSVAAADEFAASVREVGVINQIWLDPLDVVARFRDGLRRVERAFRRARRSLWRPQRSPESEKWDPCSCPIPEDVVPRHLDVFVRDSETPVAGVVDPARAIELPRMPRTSPQNIGYLLRRASRLVNFGAPSALEQLALRLGCPVFRAGADGSMSQIDAAMGVAGSVGSDGEFQTDGREVHNAV